MLIDHRIIINMQRNTNRLLIELAYQIEQQLATELSWADADDRKIATTALLTKKKSRRVSRKL